MPFLNDNPRQWAPALALATVLQTGAATPPDPIDGHAPDRIEIARAVEIVKADPNLATEHKVRTLRWIDETHRPHESGGSLKWIFELISWIAQSARVFVWVAIAVLIGLLSTYLIRLFRSRRSSLKPTRTTAPTHVQDLDIRPESLPDNIGAAARALWDASDHRAALSLLYRGLLSRLAHVHNVPIRDSSTEGDCLRLAATKLGDAQREYAQGLIQIWVQAVYGGRAPETGSLYALCDAFAPALDAQ